MKTSAPAFRVIAFDPGFERLGVAVLERPQGGRETLLFSHCITTSPKLPFPKRLFLLAEAATAIYETYHPSVCALETLYVAKNQKTAMHVAEVRGMLMYLALIHQAELCEYTPLEVKVAVTSNGKSSKEAMMRMVPRLVSIEKAVRYDDEYDAIAVGLTCLARKRIIG